MPGRLFNSDQSYMFKQAAPFLFCPACFLFRVNPRHIFTVRSSLKRPGLPVFVCIADG